MKTWLFYLIGIAVNLEVLAQDSKLNLCWEKQVKPLQSNMLSFQFEETRYEREDRMLPWQGTPYHPKGEISLNGTNFRMNDSVKSGVRWHHQQSEWNREEWLHIPYGGRTIREVSSEEHENYLIQTCRYSPVLMIQWMKDKAVSVASESNNYYSLYKTLLGNNEIGLYVRNSDGLVYQITVTSPDAMLGDVLSSYQYNEYKKVNECDVPAVIGIQKYNGRMNDQVKLSGLQLTGKGKSLLTRPPGYQMKPKAAVREELTFIRNSDQIHFLELKNSDERCLLVEFSDFLVLVNAPESYTIGEMLVKEARKQFPNKPIRYFVPCSHHAGSAGGLRALVKEGARILCLENNRDFLHLVATNTHRLTPDGLQKEPVKPLWDTLKTNPKVIRGGGLEMQVWLMGDKSLRANDYLLIYFPKTKTLFQDDLMTISASGTKIKASSKQRALYDFIRQQKLDVEQIVQSRYAHKKGFKSVATFSELEASVK